MSVQLLYIQSHDHNHCNGVAIQTQRVAEAAVKRLAEKIPPLYEVILRHTALGGKVWDGRYSGE